MRDGQILAIHGRHERMEVILRIPLTPESYVDLLTTTDLMAFCTPANKRGQLHHGFVPLQNEPGDENLLMRRFVIVAEHHRLAVIDLSRGDQCLIGGQLVKPQILAQAGDLSQTLVPWMAMRQILRIGTHLAFEGVSRGDQTLGLLEFPSTGDSFKKPGLPLADAGLLAHAKKLGMPPFPLAIESVHIQADEDGQPDPQQIPHRRREQGRLGRPGPQQRQDFLERAFVHR